MSQQDTPCADVDDALRRAGEWMLSGSPPHQFAGEPAEDWCRVCGCGSEGFQHQGGNRPPEPEPDLFDRPW